MRRILAVVAAAVATLALAGCAQRYDLATVRERADEMSRRLLEASYASDAFGEESRLSEIVAEYDDLAEPGLARYVDSERKRETDPRERKRLDYLYYDVVGTITWRESAAIEDEITDAEVNGTVSVRGEDVPYREIDVLLYNETDSALRQEYYRAMGEFDVRETNPLRAEIVSGVRERLRRFGFRDLDAFEAARRGIDHDLFEATVEEFLAATRDIYWDLTSDAAESVFGVPVTEVKDYDRGRLFRGAEFDRYFPVERMFPVLEASLLGMGIDLNELPMIQIDAEDRPEKEPRAASYGIIPGKDVRVLMKPVGGADDYETLFHEMGHALHDAFATVGEYEFQRLGDYGTTETHAFLLEGLLSNARYLEDERLITDPNVRKDFLKKQLLSDLGSARYYGGLFRYERVLHRGDVAGEDLIDAYARFMEESRLVPLEHPEYGYLSSDEGFYGVNYLEAWFLSAQIRAVLTQRFGEEWWASTEAGDFLKHLWSYGAELSPNEIAVSLGYDGLDSRYFIAEVEEAYREYR